MSKNVKNSSGYTTLNFNASAGATGPAGPPGGVQGSWFTLGNTGTTSSDFVGTRDNQSLILGTNGVTGATGAYRFTTNGRIEPLGPNILIGNGAGSNITSGTQNIAIGQNAGTGFLGTENNCIFIGCGNDELAQSGANGRCMIGNSSTTLQTFIQGCYPNTIGSATYMLINSSGACGSLLSSETLKENIIDMGTESECIYQFQPKLFNYIANPEEQSYGLIAEQIYQIRPDIVVKNANGECEMIQYQYVENMVLNEVIRNYHRLLALEQRVLALEGKINV